MEYFRMLTTADIDAYYHILHRGYQSDRKYPISFAAMDATKEEEYTWLQEEPTYGLFADTILVSAITLRMPWSKKPGPKIAPHIGQFVTDPDYKHQGYAKKLLRLTEQEILIKQLKAPLVTLGTASTHPWLHIMYEKMGFVQFDDVQLPHKKHRTLYFEKFLLQDKEI